MQKHLFDIDTVLITPRTVARRFREGDGDAFFKLIKTNKERLHDFFPATSAANTSPEASEFFVRGKLANWLRQEGYGFAIWHQADEKIIGYLVIKTIDWSIPKAELAYFIDAEYVEQGLMTEASKAVVEFAFQQLQLKKLFLYTSTDNTASRRLVAKLGFRPVGTLQHNYLRPDGITVDMILYELTGEEWTMMNREL